MTHVAVDLDGVVLDFCGGLFDAVYVETGCLVTEAQVTEWDLKDLLNPILGESWWTWLKDRSWLWAHFPPLTGALNGLRRLRSEGAYLECVTSKPEWAERYVWQWIGEHGAPFDRVTIVRDEARKSDATEAGILIDDKVENCLDFAAAGREALLLNHAYNQRKELPIGVTRVANWRAVVSEVRAFIKRQSRPDVPLNEQDEIIETFTAMLRRVTADGARKRHRGEKPSWKVDTSHEAAIFSHLRKWKAGELVDADSGAHPLVHLAWRALAIASQET